ncbi:hypothetical protein [Asticcacaulis benevestitus]|uniref:Uncharacterized protein n=1 Tax=Asticcacaulis benevestitus DSM 16100 = ATCC BAA-896 TaxID=1121022 RepID=V4PIL8_9CAUL|nr:hypothetical protein [Asticcacaulis benevestitus]ESQ93792.1 hypothetical protein ABENE_03660 [Asticcacaulis benevestitus DSM 16100 = ATCC BAA-896]
MPITARPADPRALGVLKAHAVEVDRLSQEKLKQEQSLRELVLD